MSETQNTAIDLGSLLKGLPSNGPFPEPEILNYYKMLQNRKLWFDISVDETVLDKLKLNIRSLIAAQEEDSKDNEDENCDF